MAGEPDRRLITERTAAALPWAAGLFATGDDAVTGLRLTGPDGVRDVLARAAVRWPDVTPKVAATLWWYGSSSTLALVAASHLVVTGAGPDLSPARVRVTVGELGTLSAAASDRMVDATEVAVGFARLVEAVVDAVVLAVPTVSAPSLWAIASDSAANRALDVAAALDRLDDGVPTARLLTSRSPRFPSPRFVDVDRGGAVVRAGPAAPANDRRRFVQRSSCCLVFEAGESTCVSCPRQTPDARARRWAALIE